MNLEVLRFGGDLPELPPAEPPLALFLLEAVSGSLGATCWPRADSETYAQIANTATRAAERANVAAAIVENADVPALLERIERYSENLLRRRSVRAAGVTVRSL